MSEVKIIEGDCVAAMREMKPGSVDAIVTDPPYHLSFMGSSWDHQPTPKESQAEHTRWLTEAWLVLKPGGFLLAFSGTRTYHRLACAAEDVGFEVRDMVEWFYGSGFPKSLNVSAAIDAHLGKADEREVVGQKHADRYPNGPGGTSFTVNGDGADGSRTAERTVETRAATEEAARFEGWGTALKPAHEPILLARKPPVGTIAKNFLEHGIGGLNIDAARIATDDDLGGGDENVDVIGQHHEGWSRPWMQDGEAVARHAEKVRANVAKAEQLGRWPANVMLSHGAGCGDECESGCPVAELDRQSGQVGGQAPVLGTESSSAFSGGVYGEMGRVGGGAFYGDLGGASRFFYIAKASRAERNAGLDDLEATVGARTPMAGRGQGGLKCRICEKWKASGSPCQCPVPDFEQVPFERVASANHHPTVKPIMLMRHLLRLVVPPGGVALDPFLGSGTTACAAALEDVSLIGIERDSAFVDIARRRHSFWAEHGEEALDEMRRREMRERVRQEVEEVGQLDLFG